MITLEAHCDSVSRIPQPGKTEPTYQVHFTIVDSPENRKVFGSAGARGEVLLIGLLENAYVFDQLHRISLASNSEAPQDARKAPGPQGQ